MVPSDLSEGAALELPTPWMVLRELALPLDVARLWFGWPRLLWAPRGNGQPVLLLPGYGGTDASTLAIRTFLRLLGYEPEGWGLGTNTGDVKRILPTVVARTAAAYQRTGQRVRLVGWSLGGVIAREVARERPDLVERVITFGSPIVGGPKYTFVGWRYAERGHDLDAIEAAIDERNRTPITVPITAIYSRGDGIVMWHACIDRLSPQVEHVEVRATHIGLGIHPHVYRVVADRLARTRRPDQA